MTIKNKNDLVKALADIEQWDRLYFSDYDPENDWKEMKEKGMNNIFQGFSGSFVDAVEAALKCSDVETAMIMILNTFLGTMIEIDKKTGFREWGHQCENIQACWINALGNSINENKFSVSYGGKTFEVHEMNNDDFVILLNTEIKDAINLADITPTQKKKLLGIISEVDEANKIDDWNTFSSKTKKLFKIFSLVAALATIVSEIKNIFWG